MAGGRAAGGGEPLILDGAGVARARVAEHAARAAAVAARRGRPPSLGLVAFGDGSGEAAHAQRKLRACRAAGVRVETRILARDTGSGAVRAAVEELLGGEPDGLFLELPFPTGVEADVVVSGVPEAVDVDVMTVGRIRRYLDHADGPPPLTIAAALSLLDHYGIDVDGREGVVVGPVGAFTRMFSAALARRGARMRPILPPSGSAVGSDLAGAALVVTAAAQPGAVPAERIAPGAVVVDGGYYNAGARGDVDAAGGISHLAALVPVPGGLGPMTISMLVDRVIGFAEGAEDRPS